MSTSSPMLYAGQEREGRLSSMLDKVSGWKRIFDGMQQGLSTEWRVWWEQPVGW